jgi:hypothetical protein
MKRVRKWAIPPPPGKWQEWAGRARAEQRKVATFLRRIIVKGLLREIEVKRGRRAEPHSLAMRDKLAGELQKIALKYSEGDWVRKALTVKTNTLISDVKAIRREKAPR